MSDQAEFLRMYRLPGQIERTKEKLARLQAKFHGVKVEQVAKDLSFYDAAFEREVITAKRAAKERGEEWSVGVDQC